MAAHITHLDDAVSVGSSQSADQRRNSFDAALVKTFEGSNHEHEIETLREFRSAVAKLVRSGVEPHDINFHDWVMQQVDFRNMPQHEFESFDFAGASFWGCSFPDHVTKGELERQGASVIEQLQGLPFVAIRAHMYRQDELNATDHNTYQWYLENRGIRSLIAQSIHDFFIQDALLDYLEGSTVVVVMGGHGVRRASQEYRKVAHLGLKIAQAEFVVATGGGPGAMEAANLGAYMVTRGGALALDDAIDHMIAHADPTAEHEYTDIAAAKSVIDRFGAPAYAPSIGVPTWLYGHEPPNQFCTWQAKMFSNAVREDGLLKIGNGGIIYCPGSAGTRQEVFQAACRNHYAPDGSEVPMVFMGEQFWRESCIYDALEKNSRDRPMHKWLSLTDEIDAVLAELVRYRHVSHLPKVTLAHLQRQHHRLYEEPLDELHAAHAVTTAAATATDTAAAAAPHADGHATAAAVAAAADTVPEDVRAGRLQRRNSVANKLKQFHDMRVQDFPLANAKDAAQQQQQVSPASSTRSS